MKHLCFTDNLQSLLPLLLHDLLSLSSFFISHPLILAYLLLLSPYLLKILFLLYPLLFSTFLLTVTFHLHDSESPLTTTSSAVLNFLRAKLVADEGKVCLTEHLCAMVFVDSQLYSYQMEPNDSQNCNFLEVSEKREEKEDCKTKPILVADEGKACLTEQLCAMVLVDSQLYSYQMDPNDSQNCNFLEESEKREEKEDSKTKTILRSQKEHSRRPSEILQRDGSMRKEKEWKRTLACKLFEERMTYKLCEERIVVEGGEEMDLLWEAYEVDADKNEKQRMRMKEKDSKRVVKEKVEEEEDEDEAEKGISGQLCCLQALKLSAVKMNLGVGRPSLVKVSMALKGMSVFHRAGRRRKITN